MIQYVPHDLDAHRDPKMIRLLYSQGWKGYGLFWAIVEIMSSEETCSLKHDDISSLAFALHSHPDELKKLIDELISIELLQSDGEFYWSNRARKNVMFYQEKRKKASVSAGIRWNANAMRSHSEGNAIKKSKVKKSKVKKEIRLFDIPTVLDSNHEFGTAWNDWQIYRKEIKKPLTPSMAKKQLEFLEKQSNPVAVIYQSIQNGWQGLFEIKENKNGAANKIQNRASFRHTESHIKQAREFAESLRQRDRERNECTSTDKK